MEESKVEKFYKAATDFSDALEEEFPKRAEWLIKQIEEFDKTSRIYSKQNEQWFLDFQDKLNEISVR